MRAVAFGLGQSTANAWRPLLREGVQKAVAPGGSVPARAPTPRATVLEAEAEATYGIGKRSGSKVMYYQCLMDAQSLLRKLW